MPPWPPYNASRQTTPGWRCRTRVTTLAGMISNLDRKGSAVPVCRRAIPRVYFIMECAESLWICIVDSGPGPDPLSNTASVGSDPRMLEGDPQVGLPRVAWRWMVSTGVGWEEVMAAWCQGTEALVTKRGQERYRSKYKKSDARKVSVQLRCSCWWRQGVAEGGPCMAKAAQNHVEGALCRPNELTLPTSRIKLQKGVHSRVKQNDLS